MTPPKVPYDGIPKGQVAIAVKRALSRAGYMQWAKFTPLWGKFAQRACANFQHDHNLKPTGVYDEQTHNALVKTHRKQVAGHPLEWAYDAYSIAIMQGHHITPEQEALYNILDGITWSIDHQAMIAYEMKRPFIVYPHFPVAHWFWNDCSGMFGQWYRWGGPDTPDPHDNGYDGIGNTATLWERGETVPSLDHAEAGDACLYGKPWQAGASAHVTLLRRYVAGTGWLAASHGTESGPNEVLATYRPIVGIRRFKLVK